MGAFQGYKWLSRFRQAGELGLEDRSRRPHRFRARTPAEMEQRVLTVQRHLVKAFQRYGLPRSMLMDNGPPWGTPCCCGGPSVLSVWLMDLDVAVVHGRPYHPQTQGKDERFHRTLKLEVLQGRTFDHWQQAQSRFAAWREVYNCERPHEALEMCVPASRYRTSPREYREPLAAFEYDPTFAVRHVTADG